jgi:uracil-DNA glycosylase family 4
VFAFYSPQLFSLSSAAFVKLSQFPQHYTNDDPLEKRRSLAATASPVTSLKESARQAQEDLQGKPFAGPAGKLLQATLKEAGVDPKQVYLTNVVKHFKWEPRGKRRIHKKPSASEIAACWPWLDAEIAALKPKVIVCLGATAAQALLGAAFE